MTMDQRNWQDARSDEAATGLEGHIRNLILKDTSGSPNAAAFPHLPTHHRSASSSDAPIPPPGLGLGPGPGPGPRPNPATPSYSSHGRPAEPPSQPMLSPPRSTRRRPNQAQRRQMNSQFTFTPEGPAPWQPQGNQARPARPPPQYQQHQPAEPRPPPSSWRRDGDVPRSHSSWTRPSQFDAHSVQTTSGYSNSSPANQFSGPAAAAPAGGGFRSSTGMSHQDQRRWEPRPNELDNQASYLEMLCHQAISQSAIAVDEISQKEQFRQRIEAISREVVSRYEREHNKNSDFDTSSVQLKCFGSLSSGFATKDSDMDLGLLSPMSTVQPDAPGSPIPRLLEKAFLDAGLGARLLSRTRVSIIQLCESPPDALRQGLLKARAKWEGESGGKNSDGVEEQQGDHKPEEEENDLEDVTSASADPTSSGDFEVPCRKTGEAQHFQLQQASKQPFSAYCGLARRILRRAGGRDVNISSYREFTEIDWIILSRVCQAFHRGLSDPRLRERTAGSPFLSPEGAQEINRHCSLSGLMTQVEGEQILQAWEDWPERSNFEERLLKEQHLFSLWTRSQSSPAIDTDPITYSNNLQMTLEKIKKIVPLQLLLLEQADNETPSRYWARTQWLINSLRSERAQFPQVSRVIMDCYVSGIQSKDVRDQMATYIREFPYSHLQAVRCRHQSLSLAHDLERAVAKNRYSATQTASIAHYIDILRSRLVKSSAGFIVPLPPNSSSLMGVIKAVGDPREVSTGQAPGRFRDPLEFPKTGLGVQSDINFSAHLALQNTALLRCYSHTDPRVRPMVLFVKHWAKLRGINSGYRGTLGSYGYVLMVLHYLVNVVQPFVCPNLQKLAPQQQPDMSQAEIEATITCQGYDVQFWRNEQEIIQLAMSNQLNSNTNSVGELLRGFFEYFAQSGPMSSAPAKGFDWGRDVLSLRTQGGLLSKQEKGWTGAKTVYSDQKRTTDASRPGGDQGSTEKEETAAKTEPAKEIRLRYLFAIEDPFELDHNVARTVTHNGIVSIRDEFRRAWKILRSVGNGDTRENLLQDVNDADQSTTEFLKLLTDIHG